MLVIRQDQMEMFRKEAQRNFEKAMLAHLGNFSPLLFNTLGFQLRIYEELKQMLWENLAIAVIWGLLAVLLSNTTPILAQSQTYKKIMARQEDKNMTTEEKAPQPVDNIATEALSAFMGEMAKRAVDLSKYDLHFYQTEELYIVATSNKLKTAWLPGRVAGVPDYEVQILRKDNSIKSTSIAR